MNMKTMIRVYLHNAKCNEYTDTYTHLIHLHNI